jgi:hypothetical protein
VTQVISGDFVGAAPAFVEGVPLPTVADMRNWLTVESSLPEVDATLQMVLDVSTERVLSRCVSFVVYVDEVTPPAPTTLVPRVIAQAIVLQCARWYRRRNSISGFEGYADIGLFRLSSLDPDIEQMVERWLGHDFY